jgi:amidase
MARSARDMSLMYATILAGEPWKLDPVSIAMPYRPAEVRWKGTNGKPRVGVMWHDGVVLPQPPMRRALRQAVDKLQQAGWEVVDVEPFRSAEAWELTVGGNLK